MTSFHFDKKEITHRTVKVANISVSNNLPFTLIAGPCAIENLDLAHETAEYLQLVSKKLSIPLIYKSSFDKANRSSHTSKRGVGIEKGLAILNEVKIKYNLPIVTDVHEDTPLNEVAEVVDLIQTPAFLCRQTNFMQRVAKQGKPINVKKGQFLSPWEMEHVLNKVIATGNQSVLLCERGSSFGYNNLVADMKGLTVMKETGYPVVFDATHSCQLPGQGKNASGGQRGFIPTLARSAIAVGISAVFMETHPNPPQSFSDGPNAWPLYQIEEFLMTLKKIDEVAKKYPNEYY